MQSITLTRVNLRDATLVILATFLISISGHVSIPLWFTPVPIATQNTLVLFMAALLGSKRGFAATLMFIMQGAIGLPVFSKGATLLGPTGGYLIGYLAASYVVGYLAERGKLAFGLILGNLITYSLGASRLALFVGIDKAFILGVAPFLIGDFIKTFIAYSILKKKIG